MSNKFKKYWNNKSEVETPKSFKKHWKGLTKAEDEIKWITVRGAHIPIKNGENVSEAIKAHFAARSKPKRVFHGGKVSNQNKGHLNYFGPGVYVSEDEGIAQAFGNSKSFNHNIPDKRIFNVASDAEQTKLWHDVAEAYPDEIPKNDPNDLIPKYLQSKGFRAVRAVGELARQDSAIGMNVFNPKDLKEK